MSKLKDYEVAAIFWADHIRFEREPLKKNPDEEIRPTLSVGIIVNETDKVVVLASDIERYATRDDLNYMIIIKSAIVGRKTYGTIKMRKPRK